MLVLVAASGNQVPAAHAAGPFSDGTFADADWDITVFKNVAANSASRVQKTSGGDPGDYQQITQVMVGIGLVQSVHIKSSVSHDPQTQGASASITYSERARTDSTDFNTFGAVAGMALRQDGKVYARFLACTQPDCSGPPFNILPAPPATPWTTIGAIGLTQGVFCRVVSTGQDCLQKPDFTTSGSTIEFGHARKSSHIGFTTTTRITSIDNWSVTLNIVAVATDITMDPVGVFGQLDATVGQDLTLTATVTDQNGNVLPGEPVTFFINGDFENGSRGPFNTDSNGEVSTTLNRGSAGDDIVRADFFDSNGFAHSTAPTTVITWSLPASSDADEDGVADSDDLCSNTPSGAVVNSDGCGFIKITGGGQVNVSNPDKNHSHSFGFNIKSVDDQWIVNLEYNDNHTGKPNGKKKNNPDALAPIQYHVNNEIATPASVFQDANGEPAGLTVTVPCEKRVLDDDNSREARTCVITVLDNGEPGRGTDKFLLTTPPGLPGNDGDNYSSDTTVGGDTLNKGNIQAHYEEPDA